jgi:hypothetical protein
VGLLSTVHARPLVSTHGARATHAAWYGVRAGVLAMHAPPDAPEQVSLGGDCFHGVGADVTSILWGARLRSDLLQARRVLI